MALYECVFIARQDIGSSQAQVLIETFTKIIEDNGGTVPKNEYWGLKTLSYRIKKNRKGHYVLLNIDAPHEAVKEMERQMGLNEDLLRNMIVRVDELEEGPSAMMQSRGREERPGGRRDRGERGDRGDRPPRDRDDRPPRADREPRAEQASSDAPASDKPAAETPAAEKKETADAGETA